MLDNNKLVIDHGAYYKVSNDDDECVVSVFVLALFRNLI